MTLAAAAFAQGAGGQPVPPQDAAPQQEMPEIRGAQPEPVAPVAPAAPGAAAPAAPGAPASGAGAPGAATPGMIPANPQAGEPQMREPSVDGGSSDLFDIPDTYVAEPQINVSPRAKAVIDNDYPTFAIGDYIFGCMASNGQTRAALQSCSCSIDVIASLMPYEKYIDAETTLGVRQVGGDKAELFRTQDLTENLLNLRRAQAEAEIRCF